MNLLPLPLEYNMVDINISSCDGPDFTQYENAYEPTKYIDNK